MKSVKKKDALIMPEYLFDACALIAYLDDEQGADVVEDLLDRARLGRIELCIHAAQLIEVYYDRIREVGAETADSIIRDIYDNYPITVIEGFDETFVREASYLKAAGSMSFADTMLVATAVCTGATIVTADWIELEPIAQRGKTPFLWLRPKPAPKTP